MAKSIYNADYLEKVKVCQPCLCWYLTYKTEKTGWLNKRKAGFYSDSDYFIGNEQDLLNGSYNGFRILVKDNVAYWRPYVELSFLGGYVKLAKFDTVEECEHYAAEMADKYIKNQIK